MPKARIIKCNTCDATFMKPLMVKGTPHCPLCQSGDVNSLLLKTKQEKKDAVLYKDNETGKQQWIKRDPNERIKDGKRGIEPSIEEIKQKQKNEQEQKRQSTYHKTRYALKHAGKWTGSMKESLEALSDEEREKIIHG
jgi:uncharacterized protein YukJ